MTLKAYTEIVLDNGTTYNTDERPSYLGRRVRNARLGSALVEVTTTKDVEIWLDPWRILRLEQFDAL